MGKIRTVYLYGEDSVGSLSLSLSLRMATQRMAFYFCVFVYIFLGTMMTPAPRSNETKNELIIKIKKKKRVKEKRGGGAQYQRLLLLFTILSVAERRRAILCLSFNKLFIYASLLRSSEFQDSVLLLIQTVMLTQTSITTVQCFIRPHHSALPPLHVPVTWAPCDMSRVYEDVFEPPRIFVSTVFFTKANLSNHSTDVPFLLFSQAGAELKPDLHGGKPIHFGIR